jgi:MFS family permease
MKEDHEFFSGDRRLTSTVISWFAASPPLASFFGTILSGLTLQYLGRQKTLVFLSLPFIAGWVTIAFSNNIPMLMCGRALTGLATGFSTAAAPIYVSECVRKNIRGILGMIGPMMLSLGILLGFVLRY